MVYKPVIYQIYNAVFYHVNELSYTWTGKGEDIALLTIPHAYGKMQRPASQMIRKQRLGSLSNCRRVNWSHEVTQQKAENMGRWHEI